MSNGNNIPSPTVLHEFIYGGEKYTAEAPKNATDEEIQEEFFKQLADSRTLGQEIVRKSEFAAKGLSDAGTAILAAPLELPAMIARGVDYLQKPITGKSIPTFPEGFFANKLREQLVRPAKSMGFTAENISPQAMAGPMTTGDKIAKGSGEGAGTLLSFLTGIGAAEKVAKTGTLGKNILSSMLQQKPIQAAAGITGGAVTEATDSPTLGLIASMATPAVTKFPSVGTNIANIARRGRARNTAPETSTLKATRDEAYQQVDDLEGKIRASSFTRLQDKMLPAIKDIGYSPRLNQKANVVVETIDELIKNKTPLTLKEVENVRKQIGAVIQDSATEPSTKNVALKMRDTFDDWLETIVSKDITTKNKEIATEAAKRLKKARIANQRFKKSELIEEIVDEASRGASGFENGIRIQFRQLRKNKKKMQGFTQDEKKLIDEIVKGNFTGNVTRLLGKFGLSLKGGVGNNVVGGGLGFGAGLAATGDVGTAAAFPLIASGAKVASAQNTQNVADYLRAVAATGGRDFAPRARVLPDPNVVGTTAIQRLSNILLNGAE